MHLAEALMSKEDALRLATEALRSALERNAPYYAKRPDLRPAVDRPRMDAIRMDDAWYYIPFDRTNPGSEPLVVRVNGLTKTAVVEKTL